MTDDLIDLLTFLGWMALPIALVCGALWGLRPKRTEEPEDEPPTETIETRRRMNDA